MKAALVLSGCLLLFLAATAAIGGPAQAAVLCSVNEDPCSEKNQKSNTALYGNHGSTGSEATELVVAVPNLEIESKCEFGKGVIRPDAEGVLNEGFFSLYGCSAGCTIGEFPGVYEASVAASGGGDGVATVTKPRMDMACTIWGGSKRRLPYPLAR